MYHAHFSLREEPFGVSPDQRFFYQTEQHAEATATLYYAIQQRRGFALLVGGAGLGKTSVLVHLLQLLEGKAETAYLGHPYFDRTTVLESILASLGIDSTTSPTQNHRRFYEYLMETRRAGKTCVVVFDEAQDLHPDTLEAIRTLSNFEMPAEKLVQIVLAGQAGLADMLQRPECEQIRQRLNAVARLKPLTHQEVYDYMAHRLEMAGSSVRLFSQDALEAIVAGSGGVPRNVNTICFNSLSLAYALNRPRVGREEVVEAIRDLDLRLDDVTSPPPAISKPVPSFSRTRRSFRSAWIAGGVVLLAAGSLLSNYSPLRPDERTVQAAGSPPHTISSVRPDEKKAPGIDNLPSQVIRNPEAFPRAAFAVQVGAFRNRANAENLRREMAFQYGFARLIQGQRDASLWYVLVGSEATVEGADALSARIRQESSEKHTVVIRNATAGSPNQLPRR